MAVKYTKRTANGFTWTMDRTGDGVVHRFYVEGEHDRCIGRITFDAKIGLYRVNLSGRGLSTMYGDLKKAKRSAESYAAQNFHALGYKLASRRRK